MSIAVPPNHRDGWLGVELRHLAALAAVAEEGSFRGAAQQLGYVQSAVSQQIASLERLVGLRLVERARGPSPVTLTRAGALLLGHVEGILARLTAAQADLESMALGEPSGIRLGFYQSIAERLVPRILRELAQQAPDLRVHPVEMPVDLGLFDLVAEGALDLAFADLPLPPGPFACTELMRDAYVLLVPARSDPIGSDRQPRLEDLAQLQLIAPTTSREPTGVESQLRALGLRPQVVFRSDINATVQALVGAGVGVAVLPRLSVEPHDPDTRCIDLGELLPPRTIALFWHRDRRATQTLDTIRAIAHLVCQDLMATQKPGTARFARPKLVHDASVGAH